MKTINGWELEFVPCEYSSKLISLLLDLNKNADIPVDILTIKKACYYARKYHGIQLRKSGEPYYSHPIEVAYLFALSVCLHAPRYYTTNMIIIAILHDSIEDTELTKEMITMAFDRTIADKVDDLTRIKFYGKITPAESVMLLFLEHKEDVLYIKLFDRLHNMRTLDSMKPEKQTLIAKETIDYIIPIANYLKLYSIEQELVVICAKYITVNYNSQELKLQSQSFLFNHDFYQLLSLIFENNLIQKQTQ